MTTQGRTQSTIEYVNEKDLSGKTKMKYMDLIYG